MSWITYLVDTCPQDITDITIIQDNARCHSWCQEDDDDESDDDGEEDELSASDFQLLDDSDHSESSAGSSCCANSLVCDADSEDEGELLGHIHANKMCRWESCPHSKCCPKLPCRVSESRDTSPSPTAPDIVKEDVKKESALHCSHEHHRQHHHHHHNHHHHNHLGNEDHDLKEQPQKIHQLLLQKEKELDDDLDNRHLLSSSPTKAASLSPGGPCTKHRQSPPTRRSIPNQIFSKVA